MLETKRNHLSDVISVENNIIVARNKNDNGLHKVIATPNNTGLTYAEALMKIE